MKIHTECSTAQKRWMTKLDRMGPTCTILSKPLHQDRTRRPCLSEPVHQAPGHHKKAYKNEAGYTQATLRRVRRYREVCEPRVQGRIRGHRQATAEAGNLRRSNGTLFLTLRKLLFSHLGSNERRLVKQAITTNHVRQQPLVLQLLISHRPRPSQRTTNLIPVLHLPHSLRYLHHLRHPPSRIALGLVQ